MRAIENNPEGAIYTTPIAECKTRKPTEREKYYIEENWERIKQKAIKDSKKGIFSGFIFLFTYLFVMICSIITVFAGGIHIIRIFCSLLLLLFSVFICWAACGVIESSIKMIRFVKRKEYEVTTFVCRGVYTAGKGSGQIYSLETENGQHIRYSCTVGLWNIDYKDEGFILTDKGAVALLPIDKTGWG
ncbi:MAG: hypothetical protein VZR06_11490 [Butyrivibrio sp.]|nr:hypothetical protein [Butyrivibrio sp.]